MAVVEVRGAHYHMHDGLKKKWDEVKDGNLAKSDEDRSYVTDGRERTGKSVFTLQQAAYIDHTLIDDERNGKTLPPIPFDPDREIDDILRNDHEWIAEATRRYNEGSLLPRITFSAKETLKAIRESKSTRKHTKAINFDEAFRGMSSKGALSKENKHLTAALMEMGQNNLVLFVTSPSFYLLELYPAVLRTNALFHIKKDKHGKRRMFSVFNYKKKAQLYQIGVRKGWGYPMHTRQKGYFFNIYPGGKDFELRYRFKKQMALREIDREEKSTHKWKKQRDAAIKVMSKVCNLTYDEIVNAMDAEDAHIAVGSVSKIVAGQAENAD